MNEYLEQTLLNAIKSTGSGGKPEENEHQRIMHEDDEVWYLEGWVNGIHSRWTVDKMSEGFSFEANRNREGEEISWISQAIWKRRN